MTRSGFQLISGSKALKKVLVCGNTIFVSLSEVQKKVV
jgi:hypothetical protein